jgi:hypothetical protein
VFWIRGFEGGIGISKCWGSFISTGAGLLNQQKSKNSQMEVESETFAEEEEEDTIELREVQELGTKILEMILEQVFGTEDVVPQSSPRSTMAQLSQVPPEHVDVDRGACEESEQNGSSVNIHRERYMCPQ